jgi:hypothetical protein
VNHFGGRPCAVGVSPEVIVLSVIARPVRGAV